jgi:hypothetical protein
MKGARACYVCHGNGYDPAAIDKQCVHRPGPIEEAILITKIEDVKRRRNDESRRQHPSIEYPDDHG